MKYTALLQKLNPDADSLLAALSKHLDDEMLRLIASSDYGMDIEDHLEQLHYIRDEQVVLAPMGWHPQEVLELTRWNEIMEDDKRSPEMSKQLYEAHVMRAFACATLLRAMADPSNDFGGENQTIAPLLESLSVLALSIQQEALRFFAWRVQNLNEWNNENPFYILALLVLVLRTHANLSHFELKSLIDWIYAEVRNAYQARYDSPATRGQWLPWLTLYDLRHKMWQKIGLEICTLADQYANSEGRQNLKALARHLETFKA